MKLKYSSIAFSVIMAFSAVGLTGCDDDSDTSTATETTSATESTVDSALKFDPNQY